MIEKTAHIYSVTKDDILRHAPILYEIVKNMYDKVDSVIGVLNCNSKEQELIRGSVMVHNILPGKGIAYEEEFIKNEDFQIAVIYHLCLSNLMGKIISWEEYAFHMEIAQKSFYSVKEENIGVDTMMLEAFNVDPQALPKAYISRMMKLDEFNLAVKFIHSKVTKIKPYGEDFGNYDDYYEYVQSEVVIIVEECNVMGYYSTHEINRFTCCAIQCVMGSIPSFDLLYNLDGISGAGPQLSADAVKKIQRQIIHKLHGYDSEEDDEGDDDVIFGVDGETD